MYQFIKDNQELFNVKEMTELFGISRSAYYKWLKDGFSKKREEEDAELLEKIKEIVEKHHRRYGSPRVHKALRAEYGIRVSRKKVAKMMAEHGLNARNVKKHVRTTDSKHGLPVCENVLNREFKADKPGQKWVSDITYLRTTMGFIYLTVILDLFDKKIIGWAFSTNMTTQETTIAAFNMAVKNRTPEKDLIFHSDRGVQYCASAFCDFLREHCSEIKQSMSRKGNCWDNACAESFFATLKREVFELDGKHSQADVRQAVFMYIETYYNRIRTHSAIDYVAPNEYTVLKVA